MTEGTRLGPEGNPRFFWRRQFIACTSCSALGVIAGWLLRGQSWNAVPSSAASENADQALDRLREGNQRFVTGNVRHRHENRTWRNALIADQRPFAVILGCSDSRVPIELVFDQGFGDLFVIRVAGNVISTDVVGSIAYAIAHLHTRLLVVMGHEGCGAVTAALEAQGEPEPANIQALVRMIGPGLRDLDRRLEGPAQLSAAVEANVRWSMRELAAIPTGRPLLESGQLKMVGAIYNLSGGSVRFLEA